MSPLITPFPMGIMKWSQSRCVRSCSITLRRIFWTGTSFCGNIILLEQLRTIDKSRLRGKVGSLGEDQMCKLDHALEVSVGLLPLYNTI